ncbi:MAG: hypothetical protein WAM14_01180 [Candidatus Nitrosopolaris sp.]
MKFASSSLLLVIFVALTSSVSALAQTTEFFTFVECSGTNGNHNVHCTVHAPGITDISCFVANPISGGKNVGDCITNNGIHLTCVIQQDGLPCTGTEGTGGGEANSGSSSGDGSIHVGNATGGHGGEN